MIYFAIWWAFSGFVAFLISLVLTKKKFKIADTFGLTIGLLINICFGFLALIGGVVLLFKKEKELK